MDDDVPRTKLIRIPPFYYLHALDKNTNVTRLEIGPQNFVCKEHERIVFGPEKMLIVPPRHYCIIQNPINREENQALDVNNNSESVIEDKKSKKQSIDITSEEKSMDDVLNVIKDLQQHRGKVLFDKFGQAKLRHGDTEIRFEQNDPFPLYPGEQLVGEMRPLQVVKPNTAFKLKVNRDFVDRYIYLVKGGEPQQYRAGDEFLYEGPATYFPQVEIDVVATINAVIVKPNTALRLRARRDCKDSEGKQRKAGEQWLMRKEGAYLPQIYEEIVKVEEATVLTEKVALHLKALKTFTDVFGVERKAGEEWIVTHQDKETHIPDVNEKAIDQIKLISLNNRQWCIINNPVDEDGNPQYGHRKLIKGESSFFLKPGEVLDPMGISNVYVLGEEHALYVTCTEPFEEYLNHRGRVAKKNRVPGERWLIYGPTEYIPPLQVKVLEKRKAWLQLEALNLYMLFIMKSYE